MSRGSRVFYINSVAELPVADMQEGDIAIENSNAGIITSNLITHKTQNKIWQYQSGSWIEILPRSNPDPSDVSEIRTQWTDETIIPNVTKIRKAHFEDIREYINFIQRMYTKRYGDTFFNIHDYTGAVLNWNRDGDFAKIYFAQYIDNDKQYLTIEFGDNYSGDPESVDNDRIRFLFRSFDDVSNPIAVFDVTAKSILANVPAFLYDALQVTGATRLLSTLDVSGNTVLLGELDVTADVTLRSNAACFGLFTGNMLSMLGISNFEDDVYINKDVYVTGKVYVNQGAAGGIQFQNVLDTDAAKITLENLGANNELRIELTGEAGDTINFVTPTNNSLLNNGFRIMHTGNDGAGSLFDADLFDGHEWGDVPIVTLVGATFIGPTGTAISDNTLKISFGKDIGDLHGEARTLDMYVPSGTSYCQCQCTCPCKCTCTCTSTCDCWD